MSKFNRVKITLLSFAVISAILFSLLIISRNSLNINKTPTQIWISDTPYSSDPLDFDSLVHHIVFYSLYSPLVTEYQAGEVTGLIAESWRSSVDFKTWTFNLRPNLKFQNGDSITPETVLSSLKRIFFILKEKNSKNGVVENIAGIENFVSLKNPLPGLTLDSAHNNALIFTFSKPIKNFLSLISFGMYSIVHPKQYDTLTGKWKNPKEVISSAAYKLTEWNDINISLQLRDDYVSPFSKDSKDKSINSLNVTWDPAQKNNSDLIYGTSDEDLSSKGLEFFGGTISEIRFIRCLSYYVPNSPCHDLKTRKLLRSAFYQHLSNIGFKPVNSFFPLIMQGIHEIMDDPKVEIASNAISNINSPQILNINQTSASNPIILNGFRPAFEQLAKDLNYKINYKSVGTDKIYSDIELQPHNPSVDICSNVSGIYIDKPQDDVQFMFKSKEGVMIPDTDGRIMKELENKIVDLQKVNELIWDQAAVWPLTHYGIGFWAQKGRFDFSKLNLARSPTMFELILKK